MSKIMCWFGFHRWGPVWLNENDRLYVKMSNGLEGILHREYVTCQSCKTSRHK